MKAVERWGRLVTAMVTPFDDNLEVDLEQAAAMARHLVGTGSQGIVVAGTTGEAPTLTDEEKLALFRVVKETVGDSAAVIANTGTNNTAASVALTQQAAALGVDGIMAVVPYYNRPSQEGMHGHFAAIAAASKLPVMLYNVPGRTAASLAVETVARLAGVPNIIALKEASGDLGYATEIVHRVPQLALYSGDDGLLLPHMSIGAVGVVSVAAHIAGLAMRDLIDAHLHGHRVRAMELHLTLSDLFKTLFIAPNPVPVKAALAAMGVPAGGVRQPLAGLTASQHEELHRSLRELSAQLVVSGSAGAVISL